MDTGVESAEDSHPVTEEPENLTVDLAAIPDSVDGEQFIWDITNMNKKLPLLNDSLQPYDLKRKCVTLSENKLILSDTSAEIIPMDKEQFPTQHSRSLEPILLPNNDDLAGKTCKHFLKRKISFLFCQPLT